MIITQNSSFSRSQFVCAPICNHPKATALGTRKPLQNTLYKGFSILPPQIGRPQPRARPLPPREGEPPGERERGGLRRHRHHALLGAHNRGLACAWRNVADHAISVVVRAIPYVPFLSLKSLLSPCARHGYTFIYSHRVRGMQGLDESTRNIAGILLYTHKHVGATTTSRVYFYIPASGKWRARIRREHTQHRGYTFIYPQTQGNTPQHRGYTFIYPHPRRNNVADHAISVVVRAIPYVPFCLLSLFCLLNLFCLLARDMGILLYTRIGLRASENQTRVLAISRVYFYIPTVVSLD